MRSQQRRLHCWLPFLLVLGLFLALLSSGCMWGVVRDVDTGKPLASAKITVTDAQGHTLATTTDANGLFGFGAPVSAAPARGPATFLVDASAYESVTETRDVLYDDNPNATFTNMSTFWDVQTFSLAKPAIPYHSEQGKFSIAFPAEWAATKAWFGIGGVLATPPSDCPIFPSSISVAAWDAAGFTSETWAAARLGSYLRSITNYQLIDRSPVSLDGVAAVRIILSYTVTPDSAMPNLYVPGQQLQEMAYFLVAGGTGYIVDFATMQVNSPLLQSRYEEIAQSFRLD